MFFDSVVNAFVAAADEDELVVFGEAFGVLLGEAFSACGGEDDASVFSFFDVLNRLVDWLYHHDHACTASVGGVVYGIVFVCGVVSELVGFDVDETCFLPSF